MNEELEVKVTADTSEFESKLKGITNKWGELLTKAADTLKGEPELEEGSDDFLAELDRLEALDASVLQIEPEDEGLIKATAPNMASKSQSWDAGAARAAIKAWATGPDGKVNVAKYAQAFLYKGCVKSGNLGDCKFPIKTVSNGKLVTVPRAVAAAKARLNQGKGIGAAKAKMKGQLNTKSKQIGWQPNTLQKAEIDEAHEFDFFTVPDRKNVVTGIVYKPYALDNDKQWASPEAIEEAAHWYMQHSQLHDSKHREFLGKSDARPIESYIAKSDLKIEGRDVPQGSWVASTLLSDKLFEAAQNGEYTGYSMLGRDLALYGSTPPGYEVQDENERMSISELARIRPLSLGLVTREKNKEPFLIAKCDGSGCPLEKEEKMEKNEQGVEETATDEPMKKSETLPEIPEEYRSYVEELLKKSSEESNKRVEEAMAKAAKLEDEQLTREFMAKASELDRLPTEGLGEILKEASVSMKPESYTKLEEVLRASNEQLVKSQLFEEIGSQRLPPDSIEGKIEAATQEIMAKSDITHEKAEVKALSENPKLYEEYLRELKRRGR